MPRKGDLKPIDWEQVAELAKLHCTEEEIAAILRVNKRTLLTRCRADHKMTFIDWYWRHAAGTQASVRRTQLMVALGYKGRKTIFDKKVIKKIGPNGEDITETIETPRDVEVIEPPNPRMLERLGEVLLAQGSDASRGSHAAPVGNAPALPAPKASIANQQAVEIVVKHVGQDPEIGYDPDPAGEEVPVAVANDAIPSTGADEPV